ncbi:MAG: Mrp/NBP35 family ATP-binding protein [Candidatus Latescibacterota bacterium]
MNHNSLDEEKEKQIINERLSMIKHVLLVLSGKGGVGKSTVAVNIAADLAREGMEVGLLDVDIHGPSIPGMLGIADEPVLSNEGVLLPVEFGPNLKVMSIGFLTQGRNDAVIWRGPMKYGVIRQFISNVEWGELDYLVIDSPPGTGDEPLSVAQMIGGKASAVVVTTPQRVSIDDVRKSIDFCRKVEMPIAGIVENMSGFTCPHCGGTVDIFTNGGGIRLAEEMEIPFLGSIPLDPQVVTSCDDGSPFTICHVNTTVAQSFHEVVKKILSQDNEKEKNK